MPAAYTLTRSQACRLCRNRRFCQTKPRRRFRSVHLDLTTRPTQSGDNESEGGRLVSRQVALATAVRALCWHRPTQLLILPTHGLPYSWLTKLLIPSCSLSPPPPPSELGGRHEPSALAAADTMLLGAHSFVVSQLTGAALCDRTTARCGGPSPALTPACFRPLSGAFRSFSGRYPAAARRGCSRRLESATATPSLRSSVWSPQYSQRSTRPPPPPAPSPPLRRRLWASQRRWRVRLCSIAAGTWLRRHGGRGRTSTSIWGPLAGSPRWCLTRREGLFQIPRQGCSRRVTTTPHARIDGLSSKLVPF